MILRREHPRPQPHGGLETQYFTDDYKDHLFLLRAKDPSLEQILAPDPAYRHLNGRQKHNTLHTQHLPDFLLAKDLLQRQLLLIHPITESNIHLWELFYQDRALVFNLTPSPEYAHRYTLGSEYIQSLEAKARGLTSV